MSAEPRPLKPDDFFKDPILILLNLDAVRRRPRMYVGATDDGTGLHNLVFAVVDDALDRAQADRVTVSLNTDGSVRVVDNGHERSIDVATVKGASALEALLTTLTGRTGGRSGASPTLGQTTGISLAVVNALSQRLGLRIWRDGRTYAIDFFHGDPVAPLRCIGESEGRDGRDVTFLPAAGIFPRIRFDRDVLAAGLSQRNRLRPDLRLTLVDERRTPD